MRDRRIILISFMWKSTTNFLTIYLINLIFFSSISTISLLLAINIIITIFENYSAIVYFIWFNGRSIYLNRETELYFEKVRRVVLRLARMFVCLCILCISNILFCYNSFLEWSIDSAIVNRKCFPLSNRCTDKNPSKWNPN